MNLQQPDLQTSFRTSPFGFALFVLKGAAPPDIDMATISRGIVAFVLVQVPVLVPVMAFPGLAPWLPAIVFD